MGTLNGRHAPARSWAHSPLLERLAWALSRGVRAFTRRFGATGWVLLLLVCVTGLTWLVEHRLVGQAADMAARMAWSRSAEVLPVAPAPSQVSDGRGRLEAFEQHLLPHEDIPLALQDLLGAIEQEGLTASRGEYRPQVDVPGRFLRYHMSLPVKGAAAAVQRFIQSALHSQKTLVLQSVQFKREHPDSAEVEARIQWVLLTRLPEVEK